MDLTYEEKRFDLHLLNFRSWLQRSLRWWRRRDTIDKSLGDVRGPTPGWTWFSCNVDWVKDLILHLCHWIKCPSFHVLKINLALRVWRINEGFMRKILGHWKWIFLLFPLRVATLRIEPCSHCLFLPKRGCTLKALGTRLALVVTLRTLCLNLQLLCSALTTKLRVPGYQKC